MLNASRPTEAQHVTPVSVQFFWQELVGNVRFGSLAVIRCDITPMAAFGGTADIECRNVEHKKARYKTRPLIFGSGGVICSVPTLPTRIRLR
jgi:hypothetical protein